MRTVRYEDERTVLDQGKRWALAVRCVMLCTRDQARQQARRIYGVPRGLAAQGASDKVCSFVWSRCLPKASARPGTTGFVACWSAPAGRRLHEPTEFAVPRSPSVDGRSGAHLVPRFPFLLLFSLLAFFFSHSVVGSPGSFVFFSISSRPLHRGEKRGVASLFLSLYVLRARVSRISSPFLVLVWHVPSPRYHSRTPGVELWVSRATSLLLDLFFPSGTLVPSCGRLVHSRSNRFFIHSPYLSFPSAALFLFSTSLVQSLSLFFYLKSCTPTPLPLATYLLTYLPT